VNKSKNLEKSVVILGKGTLAIKVCKWLLNEKEFNLRCIVPVVPEPIWTESLINFAKSNSVPYVKSGNVQDLDEIINVDEIDLFFSIFFETILEREFIDRCKRIINFHPSPLPKYRGIKPINWFLKDHEGEEEATYAVSVLEINEGIDSGPIISQVSFQVYPKSDEVIDIFNRSLDHGHDLITHTLRKLDSIVPSPQNEEHASIYSSKDNHLLGNRLTFTKESSRKYS